MTEAEIAEAFDLPLPAVYAALAYYFAALFNTLENMALDGMVFNRCGPIKLRAFALAFAAEVLHRG